MECTSRDVRAAEWLVNQSFGDRTFALSFFIDPELQAMLRGVDAGLGDGDTRLSSSLTFVSSIERYWPMVSYDGGSSFGVGSSRRGRFSTIMSSANVFGRLE